jgi:hypothetical protein
VLGTGRQLHIERCSVSPALVMLWMPSISWLEARPVAIPAKALTVASADAYDQSVAATPDGGKARSL